MPTTVAHIFAAAGLMPAGAVRWGAAIPERGPGNYVVALTDDPFDAESVFGEAPIDEAALRRLLKVRPELRIDGSRPSITEFSERLRSFWLPEVVLYIGLAGTSVRNRVGQYYQTPLGARRPHAGGWWLKTLTILDTLWVHYAGTRDDAVAEVAMLKRFVGGLDPDARAALPDPDNPAPFANLRTGRGDNKKHGITGATGDLPKPGLSEPTAPQEGAQPRMKREPPAARRASVPEPLASGSVDVSQNVTAADLMAGRIRFPRSAKRLFPPERAYVDVAVRGSRFEAVRWDPRSGPDKERSGALAFGKGKLDQLVAVGDVLAVRRGDDVTVELR